MNVCRPQNCYLVHDEEADSKCGIDRVSHIILRPPRQHYDLLYFHSVVQRYFGDSREIKELAVPWKGHSLPLTVACHPEAEAIVLYCHGNSGSRLGATHLLPYLPNSLGLACFDFANSGLSTKQDSSQDNYVSLGLRESKQVDCVSAYLKATFRKQVVLWGVSMGAVSCLLSSWEDVMVLDSPFADLERLGKELAFRNSCCAPNCFASCLLGCLFWAIKRQLASKLGEDVDRLNVLKHLQAQKFAEGSSYLVFMAGSEDSLIDLQHSVDFYRAYRGEKQLLLFQGTHNSRRPEELHQQAFFFVLGKLRMLRVRGRSKPSLGQAADTDRALKV